jgi:3-hydroxyisobutyrate dehydrogenase-like beta-hydroxyacid dehydrogenase
MSERIGWIGLGIMGSRQAANLRRAGHELVVWNRTAETAEAWAAEHGATVAGTPAELAAQVDVLFTMVVDGDQVENVLLGAAGAAEGAREGLLCVDCSTIGPAAALRIGAALAERGVGFMDAPVTGSSPKAQDGTLTFMAGGEVADFERVLPLLEAMGERIVHAGPLGHGQGIKLINNTVAAANTSAVAQALFVGAAQGLDLDKLVEVMGSGSGGSAVLALKAGPMQARDWSTLFKLEHMLKDVRLALEEAHAAGTAFPVAEQVAEQLSQAVALGHGEDDFAAVFEALERASEPGA